LRYLNHSTIFIARTRLVAGVDTIDITNAGTGWFSLNHDVYADSPTIVADMRQIMKAGVCPPDRRTKEFEAILGKEGSTYWRLRLPAPSQ
jgi:hypothetical protein